MKHAHLVRTSSAMMSRHAIRLRKEMALNTSSAQQICVAPLSSPYSLLPRAHTYALVAALILPLPRGWLFRAALAAFTTRTAIFAIDAVVILHGVSSTATFRTEPLPLDAVVVLEILGLAVIVACWLLLVSRRVSESSARPLVRVWAVVVTVGSILAFVSVARLGNRVAAGEQSGSPIQEECDGVWMDEMDLFGAVESVRVLGPMGWKFAWFERRVGIPPLVFSAVALLGISSPGSRRSAEGQAVVELYPDIISTEKAGGAVLGQVHPMRRLLQVMMWLTLPATAIFMIVSAEQFLLVKTSSLPSAEGINSVGQWGVWAATGAVLAATLINAVREKMGLQKETTLGQDESDTVIVR